MELRPTNNRAGNVTSVPPPAREFNAPPTKAATNRVRVVIALRFLHPGHVKARKRSQPMPHRSARVHPDFDRAARANAYGATQAVNSLPLKGGGSGWGSAASSVRDASAICD